MMAADISVIKGRAQEIEEGVVECLREFLARAEDGEFNGLMIVAFRPDGTYRFEISRQLDQLHRIGALEMLKWEVIAP